LIKNPIKRSQPSNKAPLAGGSLKEVAKLSKTPLTRVRSAIKTRLRSIKTVLYATSFPVTTTPGRKLGQRKDIHSRNLRMKANNSREQIRLVLPMMDIVTREVKLKKTGTIAHQMERPVKCV
jgi:hypothetical protein